MALIDDVNAELFEPGLFFDDQELCTWRSFVISDGTPGGTLDLWIPVQWDTDTMRQRGIELAASGLILGDVLVFTRVCDWPKRPRPNTYIFSPREEQYEIIRCIENAGVYEMSLRGPTTNY